jgi:hypothetical protein
MCQEQAPQPVGGGGVNGPLSERPVDEIRAVQAALEGNHRPPKEARYAVGIRDGLVVLLETGDLATISPFDSPVSVSRSELWRADLETVEDEIGRRHL